MASKAQKTKRIRRRKATKNGRRRKAQIENSGSTPKFAIHPEKSK